MTSPAEKFDRSFQENLLNSVLIPLANYFAEEKIEVDLKELKELFNLPLLSGCTHKPLRSKNPQPCGKETLPGEEFCKQHSKKKETKPPLLSRLPKSLSTPSQDKKMTLDLKNLPPLKLRTTE